MTHPESRIRDALRRQFGVSRFIWQEAAIGGTPGAPDCWFIAEHGSLVALELKADPKQRLRPAQKRLARLMARHGLPYFVLSRDGGGWCLRDAGRDGTVGFRSLEDLPNALRIVGGRGCGADAIPLP